MTSIEAPRRCAVLAIAAGFLCLGMPVAPAFAGTSCGPSTATRPMTDAEVETCMALRAQCAQGADAACKTLGMTRDEAEQHNPFRLGDKPTTTPLALPATNEVQPIALADLAPDSRRTFEAVKTATVDLPDNFKLGPLVSASATLAECTRSIDGPLILVPEDQGTFRLFKNADDAARFVSAAMKGKEKDWLPPKPYRQAVAGSIISKTFCMTTQQPGSLIGLDWIRCFANLDNVVAISTIVYPHIEGSKALSDRYDGEAAKIASGMVKLYNFVSGMPAAIPSP